MSRWMWIPWPCCKVRAAGSSWPSGKNTCQRRGDTLTFSLHLIGVLKLSCSLPPTVAALRV